MYFSVGFLSFSIAQEKIRSEFGVYINFRSFLQESFCVCIQVLEDFLPVDACLVGLFQKPQKISKADTEILHWFCFCISISKVEF